MVVDDLAPCVARSLASIEFTHSSRNIPVSVPTGLWLSLYKQIHFCAYVSAPLSARGGVGRRVWGRNDFRGRVTPLPWLRPPPSSWWRQTWNTFYIIDPLRCGVGWRFDASLVVSLNDDTSSWTNNWRLSETPQRPCDVTRIWHDRFPNACKRWICCRSGWSYGGFIGS